ncbi:Sodium channel protein para [Orchesella cincta]|uniref:Sodium channel protein para n=1 Tax=Orchesella cincta TaxID=48709 RepID=A0A1D2MFB5_ORCCI|nr:Sodium channel protein para [Orchesella cincta]
MGKIKTPGMEPEGRYSSHQLHPGSTGVDRKDVMVLNDIMKDLEPPEDLKVERVAGQVLWKKSFVPISLSDIFCLWDCGFPWSFIKKIIAFVVFDAFTELFITLAIVVNTVFMALDHYGLEENYIMDMTLKSGNKVFTTIFGVECAAKLMAMSPKFYFQVGWNVFDFIIVVFH